MKFLGQFIVRVADLVEAEGRLAKQSAFALVAAVVTLVAAAALLLVGTFTLAAAVYLALRRVLPADGACAVIGAVLVMLGLGCASLANRQGNSR